ncbi:MAG: hypothetical protein GTO14_16710 [Anaerolineales bacterium]|nr:hypothetical protein [Anaerolineales bacterium]
MPEIESSKEKLRLRFSKRRVTRTLILVVVLLHVINAVVVWVRFTPVAFPLDDTFISLFGVSSEGKIPTWYSASTLLFSSFLLALIAYWKRKSAAPYALGWGGLAILFALMSLDEATSIHEMTTGPIRAAFDTEGVFYYAWVIPGIAFVLLFGILYLRFLMHLPSRARALFAIAGLVYLGGVLGMELVGSAYTSRYGWSLTYGVLASVEEVLEMSGVVIFIYALLDYMERNLQEVYFELHA